MPFVHIRVAGPVSITPAQVRRLQSEATRLMATIMRKKAELTSVLVEEVPLRGWSVGGEPVPMAAHLDVKVTEGTNTVGEKERFIAAATTLLQEVMGDALPVVTYVVIDEVPADAWGYGGRSQERRRQALSSAEAA